MRKARSSFERAARVIAVLSDTRDSLAEGYMKIALKTFLSQTDRGFNPYRFDERVLTIQKDLGK